MSLSLGIVGLPNVGKSTLFHALTKQPVEIANYPFCTIDPNVGVVEVPDARIQALSEISRSEKMIPAVIEFVDIAGLIGGAHKGEGLGNAFLENIRQVDAICHVIRVFEDENIIHVGGKVDPLSDRETIHTELILSDLKLAQQHFDGCKKNMKPGTPASSITQWRLLEKITGHLAQGKLLTTAIFTDEEKPLFESYHFLTAKPMITVLNMDEKSLERSTTPSESLCAETIPLCLKLESELADLTPQDLEEYKKEFHLTATGLEKLITTSYRILNLITFFTTGPKETRGWTITKGSTAPQAAGKIHTDFEKGFIVAETIFWKDIVDCGGWSEAREKGFLRIQGKEYLVKDGDSMIFRFAK